MPELGPYGSVRGARGNSRPYRDPGSITTDAFRVRVEQCPLCLRLCCKSRKLQGHEFFAKTRNGMQSPIRVGAIALSKSPVSLTLGDEAPHIFTRKPRLRPLEFLTLGAKRLLQHNPSDSDRSRHVSELTRLTKAV